MGSDRKNEIADIRVAKNEYKPERQGEEFRHPERVWSRAVAPSRLNGPVEVVRASDPDASCSLSFAGFLGMSNW